MKNNVLWHLSQPSRSVKLLFFPFREPSERWTEWLSIKSASNSRLAFRPHVLSLYESQPGGSHGRVERYLSDKDSGHIRCAVVGAETQPQQKQPGGGRENRYETRSRWPLVPQAVHGELIRLSLSGLQCASAHRILCINWGRAAAVTPLH